MGEAKRNPSINAWTVSALQKDAQPVLKTTAQSTSALLSPGKAA